MPTKGFRSLARKLESMGDDMEEAATRAVASESTSIATAMKENVIANDAVASTELFRGINAYRVGNKVAIESSAPHSGFVEFGTGPRHVDNPYTRRYDTPDLSGELVTALVQWAQMKPSLFVADPVNFAWEVALKISGNKDTPGGTDPQPFFVPAWESGKPSVVSAAKQAAKKNARF